MNGVPFSVTEELTIWKMIIEETHNITYDNSMTPGILYIGIERWKKRSGARFHTKPLHIVWTLNAKSMFLIVCHMPDVNVMVNDLFFSHFITSINWSIGWVTEQLINWSKKIRKEWIAFLCLFFYSFLPRKIADVLFFTDATLLANLSFLFNWSVGWSVNQSIN